MDLSKGQFLIYKSKDEKIEIDVILNEDNIWLTQKQMAELFGVESNTITYHTKEIFKSAELQEDSVTRKIRATAKDGKSYLTNFYNLDMIISIGYRVNSLQGTQFRIWATERLNEYLVKGFTMDDAKLSGTKKDYFEELNERVRAIRLSERFFWDKIKDIFSSSYDYNPSSKMAKEFFATVQNIFHYAITTHTAAELITERVSSNKDNLGLTTWHGEHITKEDIKVAKNYLTEFELKQLNLLAEQFLSFAELQSLEKRVMYMATWVSKLIGFIQLNDKPVLKDSGHISSDTAKEIALSQYKQWEIKKAEQARKLKDFLQKNTTDVDFEEIKAETKSATAIPTFDKQLEGLLKTPPPKKDDK